MTSEQKDFKQWFATTLLRITKLLKVGSVFGSINDVIMRNMLSIVVWLELACGIGVVFATKDKAVWCRGEGNKHLAP